MDRCVLNSRIQDNSSDSLDDRIQEYAYRSKKMPLSITNDSNNRCAEVSLYAGEPSGTAGKPMLNVLQHKGIGEIVVVVSRYFGGIKLGAGGLVRAYGSSVQQAIDALPLHRCIPTITAVIHTPFSLEDAIRRLLDKHAVPVINSIYQSNVELHVEIEDGKQEELKEALSNASSGTASIRFPNKAQ